MFAWLHFWHLPTNATGIVGAEVILEIGRQSIDLGGVVVNTERHVVSETDTRRINRYIVFDACEEEGCA